MSPMLTPQPGHSAPLVVRSARPSGSAAGSAGAASAAPAARAARSPWLALCGLAVALTLLAPQLAEARRRGKARETLPKAPPRVLLLGSSSMKGILGRTLEVGLERDGHDVFRLGRSSAGLSRPDFFDWDKQLSRVSIDSTTQLAVVYLGVNDAQGIWLRPEERTGPKRRRWQWVVWKDKRWPEVYRQRMRSLIDGLCARGVHDVAVIPPLDVRNDRLQRRLERVRQLQAEAARTSQCGRVVSARRGKGPQRVRASLRAKDGVHLTRKGARRVWSRIGERIGALAAGDGAPRT